MSRLWQSIGGAFLFVLALGMGATAAHPRRPRPRPRPRPAYRPRAPRWYKPVPRRLAVLPRGWVTVTLGGRAYYYVGGVYYKPVIQSGSTVYVVVTP